MSAEALTGRLRDPFELDMVRHECAEALGSVGGKEVEEELARCLDVCFLNSGCEIYEISSNPPK